MLNRRWLVSSFSLALLGAVVWPIRQNWRSEPRDDFPLSYYPMFSARRGKRVRVTYLLGIDAAGQRLAIDYRLIGPGGFNQVRRQLRRIVIRGGAARLCQQLAPRVSRAHPTLVTLQVVTGSYRLDRFFAGDRRPVAEIVHAEICCRPAAEQRKEA